MKMVKNDPKRYQRREVSAPVRAVSMREEEPLEGPTAFLSAPVLEGFYVDMSSKTAKSNRK